MGIVHYNESGPLSAAAFRAVPDGPIRVRSTLSGGVRPINRTVRLGKGPSESSRLRSPPPWLNAVVCAIMLFALNGGGKANAQFKITVFDSIAVSSITFKGNSSISDQEFLVRMQTQETSGAFSSWLFKVFGSKFPGAQEQLYFDEPLYQDDIALIRQFYKNYGFFEASVKGDFTVKDKEVEVLFEIVEGRPSLIDSISYRNIHTLPADLLESILSAPILRVGKPYRADEVQEECYRILDILANNGFPQATADSIVIERKLSNNNVVVKLTFNTGRLLYFGDITEVISGDVKLNLSRRIIHDRLDFEKGEVYSRERQNQGETNLIRLGVFSSVQLTPTFPKDSAIGDSLVPISMELAPREQFELAPAVLLNNQMHGLSAGGEVSFTMRNIFGGAQSITSKINVLERLASFPGTYQAGAQIRFDQPYLFSNTNSGFISGSYNLVREEDLADGSITQIIVGAKRFFSNRLVGQASWTYEISEFSGDPKALLGNRLITLDTTETINFRNSIRSAGIDLDLTDDLFNPSRGTAFKFLGEEAGFLEDIGVSPLPQEDVARDIKATEYVKLEGTAKYFMDLSANRTMIFGTRGRLGSIFRYGRSKDEDLPVPPNRRYYAGGASSIRGWTARELAADTSIASFGSNALLELSAEIRWHLFPTLKDWPIWFVLFVDAGNLWADIRDMTFSQTAVAFGFGLRYNFFFGPLRVDFGLKGYDPSLPEDKWFYQRHLWDDVIRKGVFQFSIGHAF